MPYLVRRDGQDLIVPVRLTPFRVADRLYIYNLVLAVIYIAIGFIIYLKSLNDQAARLFFTLCLLFGIFFVTNLNRSSYFWGDIITQNAGAFARFCLPAIFLHFFLVFPEKKVFFTRYPFAEPLIYLLPAMFYVRFTLDQFFGSHAPRIGVEQWLALGIFFSAGLIALLHSYHSYRDPLQKQRVRILTIGTVTAVVPFLIFKVALDEMTANSNLAFLGIAPLVAIPASFGYCIARYRVMQVEVILKRSLIYTVLTGAVVAFYFVLALGLGVLFVRLSRQTSQIVLVGATLGIAALLWPARTRVQDLLDRRFFRTRSHLASVLQDFSREIPRLIQREVLLQRVGARLCRVLDLPALAVYLRDDSGPQVAWRLAGRVTPEPDPAVTPERGRSAPAFPHELSLATTAPAPGTVQRAALGRGAGHAARRAVAGHHARAGGAGAAPRSSRSCWPAPGWPCWCRSPRRDAWSACSRCRTSTATTSSRCRTSTCSRSWPARWRCRSRTAASTRRRSRSRSWRSSSRWRARSRAACCRAASRACRASSSSRSTSPAPRSAATTTT